MFNTNSFFHLYQCPEEKLKKSKCTKPYCRFSHEGNKNNDNLNNNNNNNNTNNNHNNNFDIKASTSSTSSKMIVDYSQTNSGVDNFFCNLRPEDLDDYLAPSLPVTSTSSSSSSSSSSTTTLLPSTSSSSVLSSKSISPTSTSSTSITTSNHVLSNRKISFDNSSSDNDSNDPFVKSKKMKTNGEFMNNHHHQSMKNVHENKINSVEPNVNNNETYSFMKKKYPKIKHYREVMMERYKKIAELASKNNNLNNKPHSLSSSSSSLVLLKTNSSSSTGTTLMNNNIDDKTKDFVFNWMPIACSVMKIPFKLRVKNVERIYNELEQIKKQKTNEKLPKQNIKLCNKAKLIEKEICERSKGFPNLYSSFLASKIRSIRSNNDDDDDIQSDDDDDIIEIDMVNDNCDNNNNGRKLVTTVNNRTRIMKNGSNKKYAYLKLDQEKLIYFLEQLLLPKELLIHHGIPVIIPSQEYQIPAFTLNEWNNHEKFVKTLKVYNENILLTCERCQKSYRNPQQPVDGICVFHPKNAFDMKTVKGYQRSYICCKNEPGSMGCESMNVHVSKGYHLLDSRLGFVRTRENMKQETPQAYALDCEMCYTEISFEICRLTILNFDGDIIYDKLIKPESKIIDYVSKYSGIHEEDLMNVTQTLKDVHNELSEFIFSDTILIGHGIDSDLRALKLIHDRIIDTTHLYPHKRGLPFRRSLKTLAAEILGRIIQEDDNGHDSAEDARTALDLVKKRLDNLVHQYKNE